MAQDKLHPHVIRFMRGRRDIWLDESISDHKGAPAIRGIQLRRVKETEVRGAESYHPFTYTGWMYYGQAFAIETEFTRSKNPLSHDQLDWLNDFAKAGGQYIEARTMDDVRDALGREEPQPWKEYEMRVTKVK